MNYPSTAAVGDEGVAYVNLIVHRELKWIFRATRKADVGIDAIVEYVKDAEAQSRLLSLQIRSGVSRFREGNDERVLHRISDEHARYYRQHSLPVVLVLYDPIEGRAYWQAITRRTLRRAEENWVVSVPRSNVLSANTAQSWAKIVAPGDIVADPKLTELLPTISKVDGGIALLSDVLQTAERSIYVCMPFLSSEVLAILDFVARKREVRILTSKGTSLHPLTDQGFRPSSAHLRWQEQLHDKWIVVDEDVQFITSANFAYRSLGTANEVFYVQSDPGHVAKACQQFHHSWEQALCESEGHRIGKN